MNRQPKQDRPAAPHARDDGRLGRSPTLPIGRESADSGTSRFSILCENGVGTIGEGTPPPQCLPDLVLDQVIDAITGPKADYDLKPYFYRPVDDPRDIRYRHEIMQDLEDSAIFEHLQMFAQHMRRMREHLIQSNELYCEYQKKRWFLEAVATYCHAVSVLTENLLHANLHSRGLRAYRDYLAAYLASPQFRSLVDETRALVTSFSEVRYGVQIAGNRLTVRKYRGEPDYSAEVDATFEKFKRGAAKDYRVTFSESPRMNHVEEKILEFVSRLYPQIFSTLDVFCVNHGDYLDETIATFDREVQFYFAYVDFIVPLKQGGLQFSYPRISESDKAVRASETFDIALAHKLLAENSRVVTNDFYMSGKERILVVSGPNQGGKTTFARTFGQLHYLARLGVPLPGRATELFLCDAVLTHFEVEENIETQRGKLEDDLFRISTILEQATPESVVILNEIFSSTTAADALFLSERILRRLIELDALCVCVTFLDELATLDDATVSMVSTVAPANPAQRTYKIERRPADGLAYAISVAEGYRLTYRSLMERIKK